VQDIDADFLSGILIQHPDCQPAEFGKKHPSVYELRPPKYILRHPKPKLCSPKLIDR
jgi:hypothetical protein